MACVARFDNGSPNEQTEPATLLGIAKINAFFHPTILCNFLIFAFLNSGP